MVKTTLRTIVPWRLLLLLLFVSTVSSFDAVPILPRKLKISNDDQQQVSQAMDLVPAIKIERRMDIELTDYPGTGANNRHNP